MLAVRPRHLTLRVSPPFVLLVLLYVHSRLLFRCASLINASPSKPLRVLVVDHPDQTPSTSDCGARDCGCAGCCPAYGHHVSSFFCLAGAFISALFCLGLKKQQIDPNAKLIYNDNKTEGAGLPGGRSRKADAMYDMLKGKPSPPPLTSMRGRNSLPDPVQPRNLGRAPSKYCQRWCSVGRSRPSKT